MIPCSFHPYLASVELLFLEGPYVYNISYRNNMGLPNVFNFFSYIMWEPLLVLSGNLYCTSIALVGRFFWIQFMCTESVILIISPMYSVCNASKRRNRFCLCLPSAVIHNKTYECLFFSRYIQMEN